jgi:signal transduction histidine kinase
MPLTEALLRGVGLVVWLFVGAPTLWGFLTHPERLTGAREILWLAAYLLFGWAFLRATGNGSLSGRRAALALQSAAALALCFIGMPQFEGALLAVVAAQTPSLLPLPLAAIWLVAQAAPLGVAILPSHGWLGTLQATGAYLAFGAFAMGAVYLRQREMRGRLELGRLNGELLATQGLLADSTRLAERLRISRDLHDLLGHHLIALGLQLELERQRAGQVSGPLAQAQDIAHRMLEDVRGVVGALRHEGTLDVASALRTLAGSIPAPEVRLELPEDLEGLDPERGHAIFRCVQEAITNAVKHGRANIVWIRLERSSAGFGLSVQDDGRGAGEILFGNGLRGMRERLAQVGGALEVSSARGRGFELRASIPAGEASA